MKKLWIGISCYCLTLLSGYAQDEKYQLFLQSGNFTPKTVQGQRLLVPIVQTHTEYKIIQFEKLPNERDKAQLKSVGIHLLGYVPNNAFFASIRPNTNLSSSQLSTLSIRAIVEIQPNFKIKPNLLAEKLPEWAVNQAGTVDVVVSIFEDYQGTNAEDELGKLGEILEKTVAADIFTVRIPTTKLQAVAQLFFVSYIEPIAPPANSEGDAENDDAVPTQRSNVLKSNGLKFNGEGVVVSMGDTDIPETSHIDFTGRLILKSASSARGKDHATHCAGIVGGAGNLDPQYEGQAPKSTILFYTGTSDYSSSTIQNNFNTTKVRVTSHSLGWTCNGGYDAGAQTVDQQAITYDGLLHVFSAGNSGSENCGQYPTGWGNITGGYKQGKNVLAVANTTATDALSSSSSRGPASDGRIKPDISAVGSNVYSTQINNTYASKSGTSMSCPAVAGVLAQLIQAYRTMNNGKDPQGALLKGVVLNTADDKGNVGPDFLYGWGRINALKAYNLLKEKRFEIGTVANAQTKKHTFTIPANVKEAKIMVYWMDAPASAGVSKSLVNDLDMQVMGTGGTYLPWVLTVSNTSTTVLNSPAQKGKDRLNNMEQVVIQNPSSGTYTVDVQGYTVPKGPQEYVVLYEYVYDNITVTYPIGGEGWNSGDTEYIRWDAYENTGFFKIEYSANNGTSWTVLSSTVSGASRAYAWTIPSSLKTGTALVRVSRNSISDVSDAPFVVVPTPTNLAVDWVCDNAYQVKWSAVSGADSYTIYQLGTAYMDSIGTTTNLSFVLSSLATKSEYYSVSANIGNIQGRRAIARVKNAGKTTNCPGGKDIALTSILSPNTNVCLTAGSQVNVQVKIENKGTQAFANYIVKYQVGTGQIVSQTVNTTLPIGQSTTITFTQKMTLPTSGNTVLKAWVEGTGDIISTNNQQEMILDMSSVAGTKLPISENFDTMNSCSEATTCEAVTCPLGNGWVNLTNTVQDNIDWRVFQGKTASTNTGPTGDHTTGTGKYLYIEASACFPNKEAVLVSPCITINNASQLTFWYHLLGSTVGTLKVEVVTNTEVKTLQTISGTQGADWKKMTVDLSAYLGQTIKIQLTGITGTDYDGDIAIDDILIEEVLVNKVTFFADKQQIETCESVTFEGNGPITVQNYTWNFGAGASPQTAIGKGPHKITYLTKGLKNITFTGDKLTETKTAYVTVLETSKQPSITIASSVNEEVCANTMITFSSVIKNGGTKPIYEWFVNDTFIGKDSVFSSNTLKNNDSVSCFLTTNNECIATKRVSSNVWKATVINGTVYQLKIVFDAYPEDISWKLQKGANIISQFDDYSQEPDNSTKIHDFCLTGGCYQFEINDAYKDGLLNDATYSLSNFLSKEIVAIEGADFKEKAIHEFCVEEIITPNQSTEISTIQVYPNPVENRLNVFSSEFAQIQLINTMGEKVAYKEGKSVFFDVNHLSKGIYFVNIITAQKQQTIQVVIQ